MEQYSHVGWHHGLSARSVALTSREYAGRFAVRVPCQAWVTTKLDGFISAFEPVHTEPDHAPTS
jgi:hypothetical protein